jgi:NitT/TauT family transport system ATP-binding protein
MAMDVIIPYVIWITLAGMADGSGAAPAAQSLFPVGGRRPGMSFIDIKNIWQEYGDHVVLERINLQVKEGEFSMVGASGCGKSTFLRCCSARKSRLAGKSPSTASRWRPDRSRGVVFQRYSVFRTSTCWITSPLARTPGVTAVWPAVCGKKRDARERAQMLEKKAGARAE